MENRCFQEISRAFVIACCLFGKDHAGGKKITAVLNLNKPISKKAWTKHTCSIVQNTKKLDFTEWDSRRVLRRQVKC